MCKNKIEIGLQVYCYLVIAAMAILLILLVTVEIGYGKDYKREYFKHWSDLDDNGLDSRQDALIIQSVASKNDIHMVVVGDNRVVDGIWVCPYTGEIVYNPLDLDIDHIIPLKYAWEHGAENWNSIQREMFANDPENLLVTRDYINQAKGALAPDKWLPPNISYHKSYITKFISLCKEYNLSCDIDKFETSLKYSQERLKGIRVQ